MELFDSRLLGVFRFLVVAFGLAFISSAAHAQVDGHGSDAWRVVGVAPDDVLNVRMGPGTDYAIIGHFAHDARGLRQITCVPYIPAAYYHAMTDAERDGLPARWCMMQSADFSEAGWVAARFLAEDALVGSPRASSGANDRSPDAMIASAEDLVSELYHSYLASREGDADYPLNAENADKYFFPDIVEKLRNHELDADPLFGGQDSDVELKRIARDPDQPMFRGMITVNVDVINFGEPQRAVVRLRAVPPGPGAPVRIFAIEHDGWTFD